MRLGAMASLHLQYIKDHRLESFTSDEYLSSLTNHEWEERENRKIEWLFVQANFSQKANLAEIDYTQDHNLDKNMFARLGSLDFKKRKYHPYGRFRSWKKFPGSGAMPPSLRSWI